MTAEEARKIANKYDPFDLFLENRILGIKHHAEMGLTECYEFFTENQMLFKEQLTNKLTDLGYKVDWSNNNITIQW